MKEPRETQRWLKLIQRVPLITKHELLDDILQETEKLFNIFVTSIKTDEKKPRLGVVQCSVLDVCFFHSMLDVRCSMLDVHLLNKPVALSRIERRMSL